MTPPTPATTEETLAAMRAAFSKEWAVRLNRVLGPLSVLLACWTVWVAESRPLAVLGAAVYIGGNIALAYPENAGWRIAQGYHLRNLSNVVAFIILALGVGAEPHGWLLGIPTMIGGAFAAERRTARYLQFSTWLTIVPGMWLAGVPMEGVVAAGLVLLVLAISVENIYVALRGSVVSGMLREQAVARLNAQLESALEARKAFLATMSHEIRTPMNGVLGMAELLDTTELTGTQREMVGTIRQSGSGLLQVINDVLDLSRLEAGHMRTERIPFHPRAVIRDVVELLRHGDLGAGVSLSSRFEGVPEQVEGDPARLRQVLFNLVGNATKFTSEGAITVEAVWRDSVLGVSVIDTGPGIAPERLATIFEPFVQGDSSHTRTHTGTGLGLSISKRLVELMDGSITVESTPGEGSRFHIEVRAPLVEPDATASPAPQLSVPSGTATIDAHVLLVDDNPVNLAVAEAMLVRLGCTVTALDNAATALQAADSSAFDIVLMDCQMPDIDGFEATRRLRAKGLITPILALTAGVTVEERQKCADAGMDAVIAKPATLRGLREALARWASTGIPEDRPDDEDTPTRKVG